MNALLNMSSWLIVAIFGTGLLLYRGTLILDGHIGQTEYLIAGLWLLALCDNFKNRKWARPIAISIMLALITFACYAISEEMSILLAIAIVSLVWCIFFEFKPESSDSSDDGDPMQSIVLLQNETRYLDAPILSRLMSEAWQIEVKLGEDDSTEEDSLNQTNLTTKRN